MLDSALAVFYHVLLVILSRHCRVVFFLTSGGGRRKDVTITCKKTRKSQLERHLSCDLSTKDTKKETGTSQRKCRHHPLPIAITPSPQKDPTHQKRSGGYTAHHLVLPPACQNETTPLPSNRAGRGRRRRRLGRPGARPPRRRGGLQVHVEIQEGAPDRRGRRGEEGGDVRQQE